MTPPRTISLLTHSSPGDTGAAVRRLLDEASARGVEVRVPPAEAEKHGIAESDGGAIAEAELVVVLGGDGTILQALRAVAGRATPVFAFNFGAIGFLSTVDHGGLEDGLERVFSGDFETLLMPALTVATGGELRHAVNDVAFHRRPDSRVAELAYSVAGEQLGEVRCDGLVAATPVGSTGYNLANGGPVLAWGVEGFVVSFIAPHTLTARGLVVATGDHLTVENLSDRDAVDISTDGRTVGSLGPGEHVELRFEHDRAALAQLPGSTFYARLREKFGRLAY